MISYNNITKTNKIITENLYLQRRSNYNKEILKERNVKTNKY